MSFIRIGEEKGIQDLRRMDIPISIKIQPRV
jgi:hypothetical protein